MSLTINQTVTFPDTKGTTLEGTIHKLNPKKAQVKLTNGNHRFASGIIINVPYSLLGVGDYGQGTVAPRVPVQVAPPAKFEPSEWWVRAHAMELLILDGIFGQLSPENLCGDGEIPMWRVKQKRAQLDRELNAIYFLLGQEIDESQHYEIMEKYRVTIVNSIKNTLQWQERFIKTDTVTAPDPVVAIH
jgi:hypothetical protein